VPTERNSEPSTRKASRAEAQDWVTAVHDLVLEILASDVREFELEDERFRLRVVRRAFSPPEVPVAGNVALEAAPTLAAIRAPLTGVFYGGPSPGAARYVQVGEQVAVGTVVGLIEAMKVFNEVLADTAGAIAQLVVPDGSLVRAGEELILVDPGEGVAVEARRS
jgi:acetyl-CoA carboxylase biotin carboxyl carrier protein